jgi:hypothetical protein
VGVLHPRPCFYVSKFAHDRALCYLARRKQLKLSPVVRKQLTEVVLAHIGLCDEDAARAGMEWMRDRYRAVGKTPTF